MNNERWIVKNDQGQFFNGFKLRQVTSNARAVKPVPQFSDNQCLVMTWDEVNEAERDLDVGVTPYLLPNFS